MKAGDALKDKIIELLIAENNGVIKTANVVSSGISKDYFYRYAVRAELEKTAHGVYVSPDVLTDELYLIQAQFPKVVFSHETALYLHDLAEKEPIPVTVTVPAKYNSLRLIEKGVKIIYVKNEWYNMGLRDSKSPGGHSINIYDMERTICDIIRKRREMDIAVFNYALKEYIKRKDKDLSRLIDYAVIMHMERKLRNVIEVLL